MFNPAVQRLQWAVFISRLAALSVVDEEGERRSCKKPKSPDAPEFKQPTKGIGKVLGDTFSFSMGSCAVSYTHLDVYKRQAKGSLFALFQTLLELWPAVIPHNSSYSENQAFCRYETAGSRVRHLYKKLKNRVLVHMGLKEWRKLVRHPFKHHLEVKDS